MEQLDDISRDSNQKENLFSFTNDHEQTALHLSILHRLPEEFIIALVLKMEKSELDQQDVNGYRAIDYLVGNRLLACASPVKLVCEVSTLVT